MILSPHRESFIDEAVSNGVFIRTSIRGWRGGYTGKIKIPAKEAHDSTFANFAGGHIEYHSWFKSNHFNRLTGLRRRMNMMLKDYTFKTTYGTYVPRCNFDHVFGSLKQFEKELYDIRDNIISEYDSIKAEVRRKYEPIAVSKWKSNFEGEPTRNFINSKCDEYMERFHTPEKIYKEFGYKLRVVNPFIESGTMGSLVIDDIGDYNIKIKRALFDSVVNSRRAMALISIMSYEKIAKEEVKLHLEIKRLFKKLTGFNRGLFYEDEELKSHLVSLRDYLLVTENRTKEGVCEHIDEFVKCLSNNNFFMIGIEW